MRLICLNVTVQIRPRNESPNRTVTITLLYALASVYKCVCVCVSCLTTLSVDKFSEMNVRLYSVGGKIPTTEILITGRKIGDSVILSTTNPTSTGPGLIGASIYVQLEAFEGL